MAVYLVNCALQSVGHNYEPLWDVLEKAAAKRAMESTWLIDTDQSLAQITKTLLALLTGDDGLFVHEIVPKTPWSATRLLDDSAEWLRARRP